MPADATAGAAIETVHHAATAKIARCRPLITKAAGSTVNTTHSAVSSWSNTKPDEHIFQSIIGLRYENANAPRAAAVLVAAPEAAGCEGTLVQIFPTARSCSDIEKDLVRGGSNKSDLAGMAVTQNGYANRQLLLPAPGSGCVVVGVDLALNP